MVVQIIEYQFYGCFGIFDYDKEGLECFYKDMWQRCVLGQCLLVYIEVSQLEYLQYFGYDCCIVDFGKLQQVVDQYC